MSAPFVPGLELARSFYEEVVAPLAADVPHSAARLGWGSDVLGYDTPRSTDHGWGPRLQLFVRPADVAALDARLEDELPEEHRGWPVRFGWDDYPVTKHVEVVELGAWLEGRLGLDPRSGLSQRDWLGLPQQLLLEVTAGEVFHDGLGELEPLRERLAWYPDEVWLWLLACQWRRIDQEEPFVGRTAEVGDDLGSRVLAARLVRDLMRLAFLQERRYAPYTQVARQRVPPPRRVTRPSARRSRARSRPTTTPRARPASSTQSRSSRAATTRSASPPRSTRPCASSTRARSVFSAPAASSTRASSGSRIRGCARCRSSAASTSSRTPPTC